MSTYFCELYSVLCELKIFGFSSWKGLYGQNVLSSYSKAVDSAHSSVRVSSSRQSNDILGKAVWFHTLSLQ